MSPSTGRDGQVAIIGGGPVGLGLAIELGQRGVRCVLVERHTAPQSVPKGQNLTQRTMEHFHFWKAEKALRAARTMPASYGIGGLTAYGSLLGGYNYDWLQRALVRPYYFTDNERLPQYATERVLRARVAELSNVETLYGWSCEGLGEDEDSVSVAITEHGSAARRTLKADYLVGCDGSRSIVREQAAIPQTCADHDRRMVLLVFRSSELDRLLERFPGKSYFSVLSPELDGYWKFFGRVDLDGAFFFHAPVPLGTTADNFDFRGYLQGAVGAEFHVELDYVGFWDLRFAVADTYRKGRIFIAGDAAHSHPPYGGYGINLGFEDAANLGWKLAAQLQGWAGPGLLDSYSEERQPVFTSTAREFIEGAIEKDRAFLRSFDPKRDLSDFEQAWAARAAGAANEVNAFEPNYQGSSVICGPRGVCSAVGSHDFAARPGHHLSPQPLSSGRNVFDELGAGFTLFGFDAGRAVLDGFRRAAETLGVPLKVVEDTRDGGRECYQAALMLVRPDAFVAWATDEQAANPSEVLSRATGRAV
jgi:4-hydroxyisophthalate hydroxylase